jgi:hypothetical protein
MDHRNRDIGINHIKTRKNLPCYGTDRYWPLADCRAFAKPAV